MKLVESAIKLKYYRLVSSLHPKPSCNGRGPNGLKALNQMIDADWGELDFMLVDLAPGPRHSSSIVQALPITGW
jgi:ATP-binding protein involved in chromosome partitioning